MENKPAGDISAACRLISAACRLISAAYRRISPHKDFSRKRLSGRMRLKPLGSIKIRIIRQLLLSLHVILCRAGSEHIILYHADHAVVERLDLVLGIGRSLVISADA